LGSSARERTPSAILGTRGSCCRQPARPSRRWSRPFDRWGSTRFARSISPKTWMRPSALSSSMPRPRSTRVRWSRWPPCPAWRVVSQHSGRPARRP
jgi:hypothetical protein